MSESEAVHHFLPVSMRCDGAAKTATSGLTDVTSSEVTQGCHAMDRTVVNDHGSRERPRHLDIRIGFPTAARVLWCDHLGSLDVDDCVLGKTALEAWQSH